MTTELVLNNPWKDQNISLMDGKSQEILRSTRQSLADKLTLAKAEIKEDEGVKEQCLIQLREWIAQNSDIENILTDDIFLLRFLRTKKYSLYMAQQMILKYLNFRKTFAHFMNVLDFQESKAIDLISKGYIFASPFRDSEGRRVVIYNVGEFDLQKYENVDMAHAHAVTYEAIIEDEETQILGVNHVADISGMTAAFATLFSITDFTRIITWGEQSFPMRHKEINLLNVPNALRYIYDYASSKLSKKLKERFTIHDSLSSISNKVDKHCLPQEMGGIMPKNEMIQLWKKELFEKRDRLLSLNKMNLLSDRGIVRSRNYKDHSSNSNLEGLTGSFRKLEVD